MRNLTRSRAFANLKERLTESSRQSSKSKLVLNVRKKSPQSSTSTNISQTPTAVRATPLKSLLKSLSNDNHGSLTMRKMAQVQKKSVKRRSELMFSQMLGSAKRDFAARTAPGDEDMFYDAINVCIFSIIMLLGVSSFCRAQHLSFSHWLPAKREEW